MLLNGAEVVTRHFDTDNGLAHSHIRDITQDSRGYIWLATWTGVDRFDGYEFLNYRSFTGDSVKLDNNRVEKVREDADGRMMVMTYTGRVYFLDPSTGHFSLASAADSARFASLERPQNAVRPELVAFPIDTPLSFTDRDGNLWLVRKNNGVDFVSAAPKAFQFIDSEAIEPIGRDIHTLYSAPDGRLWASARDKRVMLFDSAGNWLGNLSHSGKIVRDPRQSSGLMVYSITSDSKGRIWLGTKQKELALLTPVNDDEFTINIYKEGENGLLCGDIYSFAEDAEGNMWLGTFGKGVAKVSEDAAGRLSLSFPKNYPVEDAGRVRHLELVDNEVMVGTTTRGVVAFATGGRPDDIRFRFFTTDPSKNGTLSNNDIQHVVRANDGKLYFSAYSGGIDYLNSSDDLFDGSPEFENFNIRNVLDVDPVQSVVQDAAGDFWVVSHNAISRFDSQWRHKATYNAGNTGHTLHLTEAKPQTLADGRLAFGMRDGVMIIDSKSIGEEGQPSFSITGVEAGDRTLFGLPDGGVLRLPRDSRDVTVCFAALDFAGAGNIMYAYRLGDNDWINLNNDRVVRLSSLPSGETRLQIRWTDSYGTWVDPPFEMAIEVPRSWHEIAGDCAIVFCILLLGIAVVYVVRREYRRRKRERVLARYVELALRGDDKADDGADVMVSVCRTVGHSYSEPTLRAEDIARELNVGRNDLRRDVKSAVGISLEDFIRLVRVKAAIGLLDEGKLNVAETAYKCGFKTPQYMAMVFKEQTGQTPSEYASRRRKKM